MINIVIGSCGERLWTWRSIYHSQTKNTAASRNQIFFRHLFVQRCTDRSLHNLPRAKAVCQGELKELRYVPMGFFTHSNVSVWATGLNQVCKWPCASFLFKRGYYIFGLCWNCTEKCWSVVISRFSNLTNNMGVIIFIILPFAFYFLF